MRSRPRTAAALLAATLAAGPALAQTTAPTTTTPGGTTAAARPADRDDGFDWGLLGLAGLAPLFMRKDSRGNVHADTRT